MELALGLQRTVGNQAVCRLLQRQPTAAKAAERTGDQADAEEAYRRGERAFRRGRYGHAYDFFMRAYELTRIPEILYSAAQALRLLGGRREETIGLYAHYLATGDSARETYKHSAEFIRELSVRKSGDQGADRRAAEAAYRKGVAHFARGDYGHAYDELTKSYELAGIPEIAYSAGQAARMMGGRRDDAINLYEQYLATGERTRDQYKFAGEFITELSTGKSGDMATAQAAYRTGVAHFARGAYGRAYDELTKSYELAGIPEIAYSAAQAARKLGGRSEEAIALYEQYLAKGDRKRKEYQYAADWLAELRRYGAAPGD